MFRNILLASLISLAGSFCFAVLCFDNSLLNATDLSDAEADKIEVRTIDAKSEEATPKDSENIVNPEAKNLSVFDGLDLGSQDADDDFAAAKSTPKNKEENKDKKDSKKVKEVSVIDSKIAEEQRIQAELQRLKDEAVKLERAEQIRAEKEELVRREQERLLLIEEAQLEKELREEIQDDMESLPVIDSEEALWDGLY